jgi:pectinesterase
MWAPTAAMLALSLVLPPPGTPTRPVLTRAEAAPYTSDAYLDGWRPAPIRTLGIRPDAVVRPGDSVQQAVNALYRAGGTERRSIKLLPGTYTGTVFIPAGGPPLTIYGAGRPSDVRIEFSVDAIVTPAAWVQLVNPSGQYVEGDPAWPMYQSCATRTQSNAGLCATVVWSKSPGLQLRGLTVVNTLLDTVDAGTHQAVAVRTEGDQTQLEDVRLIGRQDTFYATGGRLSMRDSVVEGDTDFVFGDARAVFQFDEFRLVSSRKPAGGVIFAPSTAPANRFGFLVQYSVISADAAYVAAPTGHLGRAWDQGAGATGYLPGVSPNGQLVIRESLIRPGFDATAPWAPAATTSRPFAARVDEGRDLDDPNYNRLWEYRNWTG